MGVPLPAGAQLAVVSQSGETVSFFSPDHSAPVDVVAVAPQPHELRFDATRRRLYVSHTYRSGYFADHGPRGTEITVIDADTHEILHVVDLAPEHAPHAMSIDTVHDVLWVSVEEGPAGPGGLVGVGLDSYAVVARRSAGAPVPHWSVVAPDGRTAYTANKSAPFVSVVDLLGQDPVRRIPVPGSEELELSASGDRLFVATPTAVDGPDPGAPPGITVIDTATLETTAVLRLPAQPGSVHVTADGTVVAGCWTPAPGRAIPYADGILCLFDAAGLRPLGEITVDMTPINIVSAPDGRVAFVSHLIAGTVSVVDLAAVELIGTIDVDLGRPDGSLAANTHNQGAHGVAYIPPHPTS